MAFRDPEARAGPGAALGELAPEFARLAGRSAALKADVGVPLDDGGQLRTYLERNPVAAVRWRCGAGRLPVR
jgi:hypothetical protein